MSSLATTVSDTLVLAQAQPDADPAPARPADRLHDPAGHVRAAVRLRLRRRDQTPGFDYVDFLMPGIIVQTIAFGGFVTALGLSEDVQKGLIDRFRSLPMSRAAVLAGRTFSDIALNCLSLVVLFAVGFVAGFNFHDATRGRGRARDRAAAAVRLRVLVDLRAGRAVLVARRRRRTRSASR